MIRTDITSCVLDWGFLQSRKGDEAGGYIFSICDAIQVRFDSLF